MALFIFWQSVREQEARQSESSCLPSAAASVHFVAAIFRVFGCGGQCGSENRWAALVWAICGCGQDDWVCMVFPGIEWHTRPLVLTLCWPDKYVDEHSQMIGMTNCLHPFLKSIIKTVKGILITRMRYTCTFTFCSLSDTDSQLVYWIWQAVLWMSPRRRLFEECFQKGSYRTAACYILVSVCTP